MRSRAIAVACLALAVSSGCQQGTLVLASEGAVVTSEDGAFAIVIPPGALDVDRHVSIRTLPPEAWPVQAPSRFVRIGEVYAVEPAGLQLREDAYALQVLPSLPQLLRSPAGDPVLAVHYVYGGAEETVRPAPVTRTVLLADGRVAIVGTIYDLGVHWTGERAPGAERALVTLSARLEADAGEHALDDEWHASATALFADEPLGLLGREVRATVAAATTPDIEPLVIDGWTTRTWDATLDRELGLHPWEIFGLAAEGRVETVASFDERTPITVAPDAPLDPFTSASPGWTCAATGGAEGSLWLAVDVVSGASAGGTMRAGLVREIGAARCR